RVGGSAASRDLSPLSLHDALPISGGAQGMGAHFAQRLHEAGAQVAVGDVNEEALAKLPEGIHRRRLDVGDVDDIESFVKWAADRSEEHTSELQSRENLVCRLLLEK